MFTLTLHVISLCLLTIVLILSIRAKDRIKELETQLEIMKKQEQKPEDKYFK